MSNIKYEKLKLENQLCFPLYASAKEIVKRYKPFLEEIDLTYTQYITMMVMWEQENINVKALGKYLFLDSGTLSPVLKKLEAKGYIKRKRMENDERNLIISITPLGIKLKDMAVNIPEEMSRCIPITKEEAEFLYNILYKILGQSVTDID